MKTKLLKKLRRNAYLEKRSRTAIKICDTFDCKNEL